MAEACGIRATDRPRPAAVQIAILDKDHDMAALKQDHMAQTIR
jgi:hypothetical protein